MSEKESPGSDLKQELLDELRGQVQDPIGSIQRWERLAARLQRATVTEPSTDPTPCSGLLPHLLSIVSFAISEADEWHKGELRGILKRLERATITEPVPTDAELRSLLQAALPAGSIVNEHQANRCWAAVGRDFIPVGMPRYAALRKEGGIEACARALLTLAGVE